MTDKRRQYNKDYWSKHKDEISKKRKKRYKVNKDVQEKIAERSKRWVEKNRDKWNKYQREYRRRKRAEAKNKENKPSN